MGPPFVLEDHPWLPPLVLAVVPSIGWALYWTRHLGARAFRELSEGDPLAKREEPPRMPRTALVLTSYMPFLLSAPRRSPAPGEPPLPASRMLSLGALAPEALPTTEHLSSPQASSSRCSRASRRAARPPCTAATPPRRSRARTAARPTSSRRTSSSSCGARCARSPRRSSSGWSTPSG